jgi:ABC-type bacteriocin/lantibiotic exporter with double-glycine peptidase domain
MIGVLIVVLHLPLILFANGLYDELLPGQGIGELDPLLIAALFVLTVLPYATLARLRIEWNPPRARLGECDC